ncbi:hypothetical protein ZEAMMB73_Zm00001d033858 [Zea mays]|uniref:Uncharacterized protein n=1 Tax=Zea mays TaxID=4577 RepID=A0A1D6L2X8_MAIZE|nr:hypothetical protein ZEAMMB73_Zm00001d033858 [Zea mays]
MVLPALPNAHTVLLLFASMAWSQEEASSRIAEPHASSYMTARTSVGLIEETGWEQSSWDELGIQGGFIYWRSHCPKGYPESAPSISADIPYLPKIQWSKSSRSKHVLWRLQAVTVAASCCILTHASPTPYQSARTPQLQRSLPFRVPQRLAALRHHDQAVRPFDAPVRELCPLPQRSRGRQDHRPLTPNFQVLVGVYKVRQAIVTTHFKVTFDFVPCHREGKKKEETSSQLGCAVPVRENAAGMESQQADDSDSHGSRAPSIHTLLQDRRALNRSTCCASASPKDSLASLGLDRGRLPESRLPARRARAYIRKKIRGPSTRGRVRAPVPEGGGNGERGREEAEQTAAAAAAAVGGVPPAAGVLHGVRRRRGPVGSRCRRGGEQAQAHASGRHGQWDRRKVIYFWGSFCLYPVLFVLLSLLINELELNSPSQFGKKARHDDRGTNWWAVALNPVGHDASLLSNMNTAAVA